MRWALAFLLVACSEPADPTPDPSPVEQGGDDDETSAPGDGDDEGEDAPSEDVPEDTPDHLERLDTEAACFADDRRDRVHLSHQR